MASVAITPSINISPPSNSVSQPPSAGCTVVPQYPYNVSMPSFAGALLPYERSPMPDDNDVQTRLPSRCVDYLSHNWDESDVWTSWKAMTRHKHEMANGVRLENASWRTWAKQRSNLKTISPETLNWLKDSDVTWLYGPLHTAVEPVPPPKVSSLQDRFNLDTQSQAADSQPTSSVNSRSGSSASVRSAKAPGKPILKYRSLSEILGVGLHRGGESASEDGSEDGKGRRDQSKRARVSISHTASDSTLVKLGNSSVGRGSSPTVGNGYESSDLATSGEDSDVARPTFWVTRSDATDEAKPKKHISFSHRVEQCIAVDSEEERNDYVTKSHLRPSNRAGISAGSNILDDDDDDDDDLLTFRSSAPRQPGLHAVSHRYAPSSTAGTMNEPYSLSPGASIPYVGPPANEPFTIARMAPTTLKSSEVLPAPSPVVVYDRDLSSTSIASQPSYVRPTYTVTATPSESLGMDYTSSNQTPQSINNATPVYSHQTSSSYSSRTYGPVTVSKTLTPPVVSPSCETSLPTSTQYSCPTLMNHWNTATPDDEDTDEFTVMGFDYFSGPDLGLGDEYDMSKLPSQHLASFQAGFNSGKTGEKPGKNEDILLPKSILKTHVVAPSVGSAGSGTGKLGGQETVLVPQIKSDAKPSVACSSSSSSASSNSLPESSSLSPSPVHFSNDNNSSGSSGPLKSNTSTFITQDGSDSLSRGRSSSRGSSASSFERSSTDRRPSSNSPTQSPSMNSGANSMIGGTSSNCSSTAGSSNRSVNRPGGPSFKVHSYDGSRSFNSRSSLIHASIGEEAEHDTTPAPVASSSEEAQDKKFDYPCIIPSSQPSKSTTDFSSSTIPSTTCSGKSIPNESSPSRLARYSQGRNSIETSIPQRPRLISEPKPASAQLDGSVVTPQPIEINHGAQSTGAGSIQRDVCNSHISNESIVSGSPTLFSLLSKQGNNSSVPWWSDERLSNRSIGHASSDRAPSRPSLRSCNSDSSTATFIGRTSFCQDDREFSGPIRGNSSMDKVRCASEDEFGFGNYYGDHSPEDEDLPRDEAENGGVISRAADIVETAKVIVGALWSVGSRSIWGGPSSESSPSDSNPTKDGNPRSNLRRASTGGPIGRSEDGQISYQHSATLDKQRSADTIS